MVKRLLLTGLLTFSLVGNCFAGGNDSNTVSLLHMDGADGSTTFTDDAAGSTHTWTAVNQAQIDTAQKKFGTASGLFDGTDYITAPDSADWNFGTGDFTIDFWIRFNSILGTNKQNFLYQQTADQENYMYFFLESGVELGFRCMVAASLVITVEKSWTPSTNTWYHVALTRSTNSWRMFVDGIQIGTTTTDADAIADLTSVLSIGGGTGVPAGTVGHDGWLDEFRISKGVARWTANFTPPAEAYSEATRRIIMIQ